MSNLESCPRRALSCKACGNMDWTVCNLQNLCRIVCESDRMSGHCPSYSSIDSTIFAARKIPARIEPQGNTLHVTYRCNHHKSGLFAGCEEAKKLNNRPEANSILILSVNTAPLCGYPSRVLMLHLAMSIFGIHQRITRRSGIRWACTYVC